MVSRAIEKDVFVSKPSLGPPLFQPTLTISAVIRDDTGSPIGVLRELVDMAYVSELISQVELGQTGELYLVDRNGNFILHKGLSDLLTKGLSGFTTSRIPGRTGSHGDLQGLQRQRGLRLVEMDSGATVLSRRRAGREGGLYQTKPPGPESSRRVCSLRLFDRGHLLLGLRFGDEAH